jgi:hypothetical protein
LKGRHFDDNDDKTWFTYELKRKGTNSKKNSERNFGYIKGKKV